LNERFSFHLLNFEKWNKNCFIDLQTNIQNEDEMVGRFAFSNHPDPPTVLPRKADVCFFENLF
jgi:hypothetical protein